MCGLGGSHPLPESHELFPREKAKYGPAHLCTPRALAPRAEGWGAMSGHLASSLLIEILVIPPGWKGEPWQRRACILRWHGLNLGTGIMPLGRHERRGSQISAEHLAWANVISQSGHTRHTCTPQLRQAQSSPTSGSPHCPQCWGDSHQSQVRTSKGGWARPWCTFSGQDTSKLKGPTSDNAKWTDGSQELGTRHTPPLRHRLACSPEVCRGLTSPPEAELKVWCAGLADNCHLSVQTVQFVLRLFLN